MLLLVLFTATLGTAGANEPERLRLFALNVGEGQSLLLQRGEHGVLIDTGHAGTARHLLDRLAAHGITRLDYLLLTHLHPDHASGYFRLREAFPKTPLLDPHYPLSAREVPDMVRWLADALAQDAHREPFQAGDVLHWQGVAIKALWPNPPMDGNLNDNSLVLEISHGKQRALLMGDAGNKVEQQLINANLLHGPYAILVAGHHGSRHTAGTEFLQQVRPGYTIISTNADNIRGYPDVATVQRLEQGTQRGLFMTWQHGEICLEWAADGGLPQPCANTPDKKIPGM